MRIHDLKPAPGSVKKRKRVGRGHGSGHGKTSGRGHNGQLSRSGGGKGPGFEGGQNPLARRLPKLPGFVNHWRTEYATVNVSKLERFAEGTEINAELLANEGIIRKADMLLKVLGDGDLEKKLTIKAAAFTATAKEKIEKAGGIAEVI